MADRMHTRSVTDHPSAASTHWPRRRFLRHLGAGTLAAVGSHTALRSAFATPQERGAAAPGDHRKAAAAESALPTIRIGSYRLTRLIVGSNPISGYSHSTLNLARHMREYFTLERTVEFIERCVELGINTWQSGHGAKTKIVSALEILRERGCPVQWFCLAASKSPERLRQIAALKPIAIVHHGGVTDRLFRENHAEEVHDYIKRVHDAGILAGVSSHNPANIAYMEEKGWENEFFMCCLYNVTRPAEEIREKLGTVPLGEPFLESDRDEMTRVIRQVERPCLAFKILGAGRLCWDPRSVESAFEYAFRRIKATDGVIVGMYPKFADEVAHDVELTMKYGRPVG